MRHPLFDHEMIGDGTTEAETRVHVVRETCEEMTTEAEMEEVAIPSTFGI
jgi:hypothetical protein